MDRKVIAAGWAALVAAFIVGRVVGAIPALSTVAPLMHDLMVATLTAFAAWFVGWLRKYHAPEPFQASVHSPEKELDKLAQFLAESGYTAPVSVSESPTDSAIRLLSAIERKGGGGMPMNE